MDVLRRSDKIRVCNGYVEYIPSYTFANVDELLAVLKGCIDMDSLTDMSEDKVRIVCEAEKDGKVYVIRDLDGVELVFPNTFGNIAVSEGVKEIYRGIKVPSYQDVLKELAAVGVRKAESKNTRHLILRRTKIKQYKRKIRITNTHVKDLNWSGKD